MKGAIDMIKEVSPKEVEELINKNDGTIIIDVREDHEVAQGIIPDAKHIPLGNIPEEIENFPKDQSYIMVCRSGARSMNAAEYMHGKGFTSVKNMEGGMLNWEGELVF